MYNRIVAEIMNLGAKKVFLCYFSYIASVVEWSNTIDCKSIAFGLRGFESLPAHITLQNADGSLMEFLCCLYAF